MQISSTASSNQADAHFRAVCRALVAETLEFSDFLVKVSSAPEDWRELRNNKSETHSQELTGLHLADWVSPFVYIGPLPGVFDIQTDFPHLTKRRIKSDYVCARKPTRFKWKAIFERRNRRGRRDDWPERRKLQKLIKGCERLTRAAGACGCG
ncbi:Spire-like protein [Daphnia magna]|uniref:Spire-like protein n=1 Tax=Daphnia magna TaxID=35525 RepID=A0A162D8F4_9CRUS|nr:Spire-like protein [Daphnia magna]